MKVRPAPPLRPARTGDGAPVAAILAEVGWFRDLPADRHEAAAEVDALLPDVEDPHRSMVVAEDGVGGLAGYVHWSVTHPVFLRGPSLYVTELFVRADQRGRGVGSALLAVVHDEAAALDASRVELLQHRDRAAYERGFYPAHGYVERPELAVLRRGVARP